MPEATPAHRGLFARFFHDWLGFEFVSRIYLYSVLIGIVSGQAPYYSPTASNWPSFC